MQRKQIHLTYNAHCPLHIGVLNLYREYIGRKSPNSKLSNSKPSICVFSSYGLLTQESFILLNEHFFVPLSPSSFIYLCLPLSPLKKSPIAKILFVRVTVAVRSGLRLRGVIKTLRTLENIVFFFGPDLRLAWIILEKNCFFLITLATFSLKCTLFLLYSTGPFKTGEYYNK